MEKDYDINKIAGELNISEDALIPYGKDKAKIDVAKLNLKENKGKLVLVTAMTPTKAGEGKTTTVIGLSDALHSKGNKVIACLREPSLGPVFGVKGGGTGGQEAELYPSDDINLHFTGDIHAITTVHNLIAAMLENELYQKNIDIDPERILFPHCMDMNERSLRNIQVCLNDKKGTVHSSSFVITAASEIMAIFCLAQDEEDFLNRVDEILLAYTKDNKEVKVKDLNIKEAIRKLIHTALLPNLVQSKYHTPSIVHGGPFANIAHGTNSLIARNLALSLADYVITEAGFGSDLGMEKYLDIISPLSGTHPDLIVMVASIRAIKLHGGVKFEDLGKKNIEAIDIGIKNLFKHLENVEKYNLPYIVSINHFNSDDKEEIQHLEKLLIDKNIPYSINSSYLEGPKGAFDLADKVKELLNTTDTSNFKPIVNDEMTIKEKIEKIAKEIYSSKNVIYSPLALEKIEKLQNSKYSHFSICMSKVPNSLSDDPHLINVPENELHVKDIKLSSGAKFIVVLTGDVFLMPGLPKVPAAKGF